MNNNKKSKPAASTINQTEIAKNDDTNKNDPRHLTVEELLSIVGGTIVLAHRC